MADFPDGKLTPWEAGYNPGVFTYEQAKELEQSRADSPGDNPNPMGNEVTNIGAPFDKINWPGGSPTNYALMLASMIDLDQGGGRSGDISIYHPNSGDIQAIFGSDFRNDQAQDGYLYTMRDPSGRGNPATLDDVLAKIGRTYGQTG